MSRYSHVANCTRKKFHTAGRWRTPAAAVEARPFRIAHGAAVARVRIATAVCAAMARCGVANSATGGQRRAERASGLQLMRARRYGRADLLLTGARGAPGAVL